MSTITGPYRALAKVGMPTTVETQTTKFTGSAIHILLVEDNIGDARLTIYALGASKVPLSVSHVSDGDAALAFLRREGRYQSASSPDIVLLDLNMPMKNGFETLSAIRNDLKLNALPVLILTSSDGPTDILQSYNLKATAYIVKPFDIRQFNPIVKAIEDFWFKTAKLPTKVVDSN